MAENIIDSLTQSEKVNNPALKQKRDAMRENTELYDVQSGDAIAKIARDHGIADYSDLLALNHLMREDNFKSKGKMGTNITIRPWDPVKNTGDQIYVPKDPKKFQADIEWIRKISDAIAMNEKVAKGDVKALSKEINERIFPWFRQSIGMNRLNDGLLGNMNASLQLSGPRQVDPKFQKDASCAHYYRQDIRSAFNIGDMPPEWKKFMNTGNIDAWQLPARLLQLKDNGKNEFIQRENFMNFFDTSKFGARISPVPVEKQGEYARAMVALNSSLEKNPNAINTAIPVYYRYSKFQLRGLAESHTKGEEHYNTHMMRYVGSTPSTFPAHEWGEVHSDGTITPFGGDKKRLEKEISSLSGTLVGEKATYENQKKTLLEYIKNEFPKHTFTIDKKLIEYSKGGKTEEERTALKKEMESLFNSGNIELVKTRLSKIIRWPVDDENAKLLIHWQKNKQKVSEGLKQMEQILENKKVEEYPYFNPDDLSAILLSSSRVSGILTSYNNAVKKIKSLQEHIISANGKVKESKNEEKNREKIQKEAREQITKITPELQKAKLEYEKTKQRFLESLNEWKNPELKTWFDGFDVMVKKHFWPNGGSRADTLIDWFHSGKFSDDFRIQMKMTEGDFNYLKTIFLNREKIRKNISSLQARLGTASDALPEIHIDGMEKIFGNNQIVQALAAYNMSTIKVNEHTATIQGLKEKIKIKKEITVVDYLLNFLQQRADYGTSALKQEGRKQILDGLTMYAGAVQMKVSGKIINITEELKKPEKNRVKVNPEDIIEFSGPVMSDGFHMQNLKDPVERAKMQGRQRYFFELLATQTFFPSEVIEPTPDSLMHQTKFRKATDSVKTKGSYSLNSGDTLEHAIKRLIPIQERAEFDKLDPNAPTNYQQEHKKLLQKYYALQIKGLQMLGYMQSEDVLNPGAIKINQGIPYFDTIDLSKQFWSYIAGVKTKRKENITELAKYREFINVQTLPGDTMGIFYSRIAGYSQTYTNHSAKYPNIAAVAGLNDFLKKEFLQRLLKTSLTNVNDKDITNMLQDGKVRSGYSFVFRLTDINRIVGELKNVSYTPSTESILKPVDRDIIRMVIPMEQNRNIIRSTMYVEGYEYENWKDYTPNWSSRFGKRMLEKYPFLQNFKDINSYGDFQVRWLEDLQYGFGEEFITKKQVENALSLFSRTDVQSYMKSTPVENRSAIASDFATIEKIKLILSQKNPTKEDFKMLSKYLIEIIRLDDGTSDNIVGKFIGASLINEKMNGHFQKLDGMLQSVGEPIETINSDAKQMQRYEDSIYLINNLGEMRVALGFAENYLYRILEGTQIIEKNGGHLQYAGIEREKGRSLKYGRRVFLEHVKFITDQVDKSKQLLGGTTPEVRITGGILHFGINVQEIALNATMQRGALSEKIRSTTHPEERASLEKELNNSYLREDTLILKEIYALLSDPEFRKTAQWFNIDTSFLPTKWEILANDAFRFKFFNHVRKGEKFEKMAALKTEKEHG